MVQITAEMVKELREKTGAGMMDCKKALLENSSFEAAVNYLREKGLAAAAKKSGRIASEGLVAVCVQDKKAAMIEVNCETDFVAKNADFQKLASDLAKHVVKQNDLVLGEIVAGEKLLKQSFVDDTSKTVEALITEKVATIGEKLDVRRAVLFAGASAYGSYLHSGGSIGAIVELDVADMAPSHFDIVQVLAKDLAMHVAASAPAALDRSGVDASVVENERQVFRSQVLEQKKPENIVDRIVNGKLEKFFEDICLLEQKFVKDPSLSVTQLIEQTAKSIGTSIKLNRYARFKVGEGLEKKADDFAEEVAKMVK